MRMRGMSRAILPCIAEAVLGCRGGEPVREQAAAEEAPVITGHWLRHSQWDGRALPMWAGPDNMVFDTEVDSIYRYRYRLRDSVLELEHDDGRRSEGRLLKLTADSLVLYGVELPGMLSPVQGSVRFGRGCEEPKEASCTPRTGA